MKFKVVIPARMQSSRLPGKPLVDLDGKSLIQRTFEQCLKAVPREKIVVLTDHKDIVNHCQQKDIPVVLTPTDCLTGTDRAAAYAKEHHYDYYINVQGDEPLFNPKDITRLIDALPNFKGSILNGYALLKHESDYNSFSVPKLVFNENQELLYMSRASIPGNKSGKFGFGYRQICAYAFPRQPLLAFAERGEKTQFENSEDIEVLRFLEMGYTVQMIEMSDDSIPVDHREDIEKVLSALKTSR